MTSSVKDVNIVIHKEHFGRMFEIPFLGTSYKSERPIRFKNFKHNVALNSLVINPMEKIKLTSRTTLLNPKV